jgi:hypothetical protein
MINRDFDFASTSNGDLILSILLHRDNLYCAVIDDQNVMLSHQSFTNVSFSDEVVCEAILRQPIFDTIYSKVKVSVLCGKYFFLPDRQPLIRDHVDSLSYKEVYIDKLAGHDVYNHFGLSSHQVNIIDRLSQKATKATKPYSLHHIANILSCYHIHETENVIHVHFEPSELHIYGQRNGQFLGYRCVEATSVEDTLYFIMAFYDLFGFDRTQDLMTLSGWLEPKSPMFMNIYGYIAKVKWFDDATCTIYPEADEANKSHYYFAHFANKLCAL